MFELNRKEFLRENGIGDGNTLRQYERVYTGIC